jgi:hypothetical protein
MARKRIPANLHFTGRRLKVLSRVKYHALQNLSPKLKRHATIIGLGGFLLHDRSSTVPLIRFIRK